MKIGTHSVTLVANKAGKATITVNAVSVADSTTAEDITGSKTVTIQVKEAPKAPDTSEATLKSITVAGKVYPNPNTDFTITVDSNISSAEISAVANNSKAKITGTGKKDIATGTNTVTIKVTGHNGAVKNYNIRIRRLADTSTTPNVTDTPTTPTPTPEEPIEDLLRLKYLRIEDVELIPAFDSECFEYSVFVTNVDNLDITAVATDDNATIEIIGEKNLKEGDNEVLIKLTRKKTDSEENEETTYTISANKTIIDMKTEQQDNNEEENSESFLSTGTGKIAVGGVVGVLAIRSYCVWNMEV